MGLTGILFLVVLLIASSLFVFALVKGFGGWGVFYTITFVFLFLSTLGFLYATASVADRRTKWIKLHDQAKEKVARLEREVAILKFGNINQPSSDASSLLGAANELSRASKERGRVWRNAKLTSDPRKTDTVKLTLAPPESAPDVPADVNAPAATAINVGNLPVEALVYAFGEGAGPDGRIIPKTYLGEFFVAESQGGTATLRPVAPLLPTQTKAIASQEGENWTVFELMPLDSHVAFSEVGSKRSDEAEFGRMDRKVLAELLKINEELLDRDPATLNAEEAHARRLLASYVLDGGRAPENEAPENVWYRIEFLAEHTEIVDVVGDSGNAVDGGYFSDDGRAIDSRLKRADGNGEVKFFKGQRALFASKPAKALIDRDVAKLIEPVFVRRINDYTLGFKETRDRLTDAAQDALMFQREINQTKATNARVQQQVGFRQTERQLLDNDLAQYKKELEVITAESARLDQAVQESKSELSRLYRATQQHYERLIRTQQALYQAAGGQ
jgi:hypothetical protein